jgi:Fe-S-cluster containining protein
MANFVLEKIKYGIEGECCKCGDCCRFMYSLDTYTEKEFKFLTHFYPKYKRFKVIGKDEHGNLILACRLIDEFNLCPDYENRPEMCRDYPNLKRMMAGGRLYERCTYRLTPEKEFKNYLSK